MSTSGHTIATAPCAEHPPLATWPMKDLLWNRCPACGYGNVHDALAIGRMVRARQLIREREQRQLIRERVRRSC